MLSGTNILLERERERERENHISSKKIKTYHVVQSGGRNDNFFSSNYLFIFDLWMLS